VLCHRWFSDQLLRKDIKSAPPCQGLDATRRLRIDVYEPAAIITLANPQVQDDASDDSRSRIATCRIQMGLCHHRDFLHEHVVIPKSIDHGALHPPWGRLINVSGNVDSYAQHGFLRRNLGPATPNPVPLEKILFGGER